MSSNYLNILHLGGEVDAEKIERAYKASRARYLRLTSKGGLKFYRSALLADVDRAYRALSQSDPVIKHRPMSLLARRVAAQGGKVAAKPIVKSVMKDNYILPGKPVEKLSSVKFTGKRSSAEQDQIEDDFCKEVIYRLEGDLIRFDSRKELLLISRKWRIGQFRANLLMAQIVEVVRQNKLYKPSLEEARFNRGQAKRIRRQKVRTKRYFKRGILTGLAVVILAAVLDLLVVWYIGL